MSEPTNGDSPTNRQTNRQTNHPSRAKRLIKRAVLMIFLLLLIATGYLAHAAARVIVGYSAKVACTAVFLQGRSAEDVRGDDLGFIPLVSLAVDRERQTLTASVGPISQVAIYRVGLGSTLVIDTTIEALRAQPGAPLPAQAGAARSSSAPTAAEIAWPNGGRLPDALPPGIDQAKLDPAIDAAFQEPAAGRFPVKTRAVVVLYQGQIVAERYADGFTKDTPLLGWSMTKSVTSALFGALVQAGKIDVHAPADVPEWHEEPGDPRAAITTDMLLRMSSGLDFSEVYFNPLSDAVTMLFRSPDAAAYAANKRLLGDPDGRWEYSSGTTNLLQRLIRRSLGGDLAEYARFPREALFDRIHMDRAVLERDAAGTFTGSSFMYATARDWARFGLLYLHDGVWDGERVLPEGWVDYSVTPTPRSPLGNYGAQWWLNHGIPGDQGRREKVTLPTDLYIASGFQGQTVSVIPTRDVVVVRLGLTVDEKQFDLEPFLKGILDALPTPTAAGNARASE